jgi:hypothetical protein
LRGKKAANAAEKARKAVVLDSAARKRAARRRKLLAKNDRKRKNRAAGAGHSRPAGGGSMKCPECGETHIAVEVKTWCDYMDGEPLEFDDEDVEYVEPIPGGERICRTCQHTWME